MIIKTYEKEGYAVMIFVALSCASNLFSIEKLEFYT
jgi:hypothetical protein